MRKFSAMMLLIICVIFLAACNSSNKEETNKVAATEGAIQITDALDEVKSFEVAPKTFAALSLGDVDILNKLGADVIGRPTTAGAIDDELKGIAEIGNPHQPTIEKIAELHPEVLVAQASFQQYAKNIENQGTSVVYTNADSIEDIQNTITMFGQLIEKETEAKSLNDTITQDIEKLQSEKSDKVNALLVYGAPGTYLAALPSSLPGDILEKAGGTNIAADFPEEENYPNYASLSTERIVQKNPDIVLLITHSDPESVKKAFDKEMRQNAAWKNLDAVKEKRVIVLSSDLFGVNPGTKIVDALEEMKTNLETVK